MKRDARCRTSRCAALFCQGSVSPPLGTARGSHGITGAGGQATYVHLDVTSEADWRAAIATAVGAYGKLNVLVNNAGILFRSKIEDTAGADGDRIMAVNVKGVFLGTKASLPAMRQAGGGSIINISSTAGLVGSPGETAAYTATKGAVRLFPKATAIQHARDGIRCNSVHPGPIVTDMIKDILENRAMWEQRLRRLPMGHVRREAPAGHDRHVLLEGPSEPLLVRHVADRFPLLLSAADCARGVSEREDRKHVEPGRDIEHRLGLVKVAEADPVRADAVGPGREQHRLDRSTGVGDGELRLVDHDDDRERGLRDIGAARRDLTEAAERGPVAHDDEVPGLSIHPAPRQPARLDDPPHNGVRDGRVPVAAHREERANSLEGLHRRLCRA